MTDKTKRIILIAAGILLCAALVVGIVSRLARHERSGSEYQRSRGKGG